MFSVKRYLWNYFSSPVYQHRSRKKGKFDEARNQFERAKPGQYSVIKIENPGKGRESPGERHVDRDVHFLGLIFGSE